MNHIDRLEQLRADLARRDGFLKATGLPYQDRTACSHVKAAFRVFGMSRILATMAKMGYGYGGAE